MLLTLILLLAVQFSLAQSPPVLQRIFDSVRTEALFFTGDGGLGGAPLFSAPSSWVGPSPLKLNSTWGALTFSDAVEWPQVAPTGVFNYKAFALLAPSGCTGAARWEEGGNPLWAFAQYDATPGDATIDAAADCLATLKGPPAAAPQKLGGLFRSSLVTMEPPAPILAASSAASDVMSVPSIMRDASARVVVNATRATPLYAHLAAATGTVTLQLIWELTPAREKNKQCGNGEGILDACGLGGPQMTRVARTLHPRSFPPSPVPAAWLFEGVFLNNTPDSGAFTAKGTGRLSAESSATNCAGTQQRCSQFSLQINASGSPPVMVSVLVPNAPGGGGGGGGGGGSDTSVPLWVLIIICTVFAVVIVAIAWFFRKWWGGVSNSAHNSRRLGVTRNRSAAEKKVTLEPRPGFDEARLMMREGRLNEKDRLEAEEHLRVLKKQIEDMKEQERIANERQKQEEEEQQKKYLIAIARESWERKFPRDEDGNWLAEYDMNGKPERIGPWSKRIVEADDEDAGAPYWVHDVEGVESSWLPPVAPPLVREAVIEVEEAKQAAELEELEKQKFADETAAQKRARDEKKKLAIAAQDKRREQLRKMEEELEKVRSILEQDEWAPEPLHPAALSRERLFQLAGPAPPNAGGCVINSPLFRSFPPAPEPAAAAVPPADAGAETPAAADAVGTAVPVAPRPFFARAREDARVRARAKLFVTPVDHEAALPRGDGGATPEGGGGEETACFGVASAAYLSAPPPLDAAAVYVSRPQLPEPRTRVVEGSAAYEAGARRDMALRIITISLRTTGFLDRTRQKVTKDALNTLDNRLIKLAKQMLGGPPANTAT